MSFTVKLYRNKSEDVKIGKSITEVKSLSGTLKEETSIINPVITFEGNIGDIADCNYMYISNFKRYYFITDIKSIRNNIYQVSGHVDVLDSFKSGILSCSAILERQQNKWNLYLDDGVFKLYQNPKIITREFPSGFTAEEWILAVAGG